MIRKTIQFRMLGAWALGATALLSGTAFASPQTPIRSDGILWPDADGDVGALRAALPGIHDPVISALARLELAASRLDKASVQREVAIYDSYHDQDLSRQALAASVEAGTAFAIGEYGWAERASESWISFLDVSDSDDDKAVAVQLHEVASLLARLPTLLIKGAGLRIPTIRDEAGLLRGSVTINGVETRAVLDTGANLPVLSASMAARLHVRIIEGAASVGSGSRNAVATRVGIVDRMEFAGLAFRNVPFLVMDDSQLALPLGHGYRIDAIIGFPVFRAMGSFTFGKDFFQPAPALTSGPQNLTASGNDLFVAAEVGGYTLSLHIDTGARRSSLSAIFSRRYPGALFRLERSVERNASAGGATNLMVAHWKNVTFSFGGSNVLLPDLPIAIADSHDVTDRTIGTLGQDVLQRFSSYTIDLTTMRFRPNQIFQEHP